MSSNLLNSRKLQISIVVGFLVSGLIGALFVVAGLTDPDYKLSFGTVIAFSCLALPCQVIATVGTYLQLEFIDRLKRTGSKNTNEKK